MTESAKLFLLLLAAHLIGDFVLQGKWLATAKHKWYWRLLHAGQITAVAVLLVRIVNLWLYVILFISHFVIDWAKCRLADGGAKAFLADQFFHLLVLGFLAIYFAEHLGESLLAEHLSQYLPVIAVLSGLILTIKVGDVLIGKSVEGFLDEIGDGQKKGLTNGGKWIGQLERALTFLLVLIGQYSAIGFLFAAKSILRFGEIKEPEHRKEAEYIIIGTFMSFGWALLIAVLTERILTLL